MTTTQIRGSFYISKGKVMDTAGFLPDLSARPLYEVIRVIDRRFLFLQEHLDRLLHSLSATRPHSSTPIQPDDLAKILRESLCKLLSHNDLESGNIRLCMQAEDPSHSISAYFIPHRYPTAEMYRHGVKLKCFSYRRPQPGIKKWDGDFRARVDRFIREKEIYEALLLDKDEQISEGSRSNIFFIDADDCLHTPPTAQVLPGITRMHLLALCRVHGIEVKETDIARPEIGGFRAAFICGTSPKVLPIRRIDQQAFDPKHPLLLQLIDYFNTLIHQNLSSC